MEVGLENILSDGIPDPSAAKAAAVESIALAGLKSSGVECEKPVVLC